MKHYVLGMLFNFNRRTATHVLLIEKQRPDWMRDRWNGIGGKIEENENTTNAMHRETREEIGHSYEWQRFLTFVCPGGTVFVFRAFTNVRDIRFKQQPHEDKLLRVWALDYLPPNMMSNLKWIIPVALSTIQIPIMLHQRTLGVE